MKKISFVVVVFSLFFGVTPSLTHAISVCEDIVGDVIWTKADSPVSVCGNVELSQDGSLSIQPGVEVNFDDESNFTVLGSLLAQGSQDEPVIFRGHPNTLSIGGSASSTFVHFHNVWIDKVKPGFYIDNSRVIFEGVLVSEGGGISFNRSDVFISSSTFSFLDGDAISFYATEAILRNVLVRGTRNGSGISAYGNTGLHLSSTTVSAGEYSGLAVYDSTVTGDRNRFISNYPAGVEVYGSSSLSLTRSSFWNTLYEVVSFSEATSTAAGSWWSGHDPQQGVDYLGNVDVGSWLVFDPNSTRPDVIFFPGIQASRLFLDEDEKQNQLWEPNRARDIEKLFLTYEGESIESEVYSGEVVDQINVPIKTRKIYKTFIDNLAEWKSSGLINDYKLWAYDWRYPISSLAVIFTETFVISRPTVFVGHSNGGLLAKLIFSLLAQVAKGMTSVVLVASPQRGSTQALATLLHADSASILGGIILSEKVALSLVSPMASVYTLLPWSNVSKLVSFDQKILDKIPALSDVSWSDFLSSFPLLSLTGAKFNFELPQVNLHAFDLAKVVQVMLSSVDETLTPDLTIYGYGIRTLGSIHYGIKESCAEESIFAKLHICKPSSVVSYSPVYKDGDGTVEVESAWPGYPATSSRVFPVNLKNSNHTHPTILEDRRVIKIIEDFLIDTNIASVPSLVVSESDPDQDLVIGVNDPSLEVILKNKKGEITGLSKFTNGDGETVSVVEAIPGTTFRKFGGNAEITISDYGEKVLSENHELDSYSLSLVGKGFGQAEISIGEVVYPNLPVVPGSFGTLDLISLEAPAITYYPTGTSSVSYEISPETNDALLKEIEGSVSSHVIQGYCIQRNTGEVVSKPGYLQ